MPAKTTTAKTAGAKKTTPKEAMSKKAIRRSKRSCVSWSTVDTQLLQLVDELGDEIDALNEIRNEIDERMVALKVRRDTNSRILKESAPDLWAEGRRRGYFNGSA